MNQLEFYKELYHKENERRQEVLTSLNIPIAIITALSSGTFFFITSFDYSIEAFLTGIFIALISLTGLALLLAIYFLIRAFSDFTKGYEYSGVPYANELYDWNKNLEEYFETYENDKTLAAAHFETYLMENLVKHTEHNMYVNDKKHGYIYRSKKFLILALVLMLMTLVPFGYNYFKKDKEIHKVQMISNLIQSENLTLDDLNKKIDSLLILQKINNYEQQGQFSQETDTTASTERQVD
jgi:hypothetical protein